MDDKSMERALDWLTKGDTTSISTQERVAALLDQIDVYRLALAFACGDREMPGDDEDEGASPFVFDQGAGVAIGMAQDELRHGRRPKWLDIPDPEVSRG